MLVAGRADAARAGVRARDRAVDRGDEVRPEPRVRRRHRESAAARRARPGRARRPGRRVGRRGGARPHPGTARRTATAAEWRHDQQRVEAPEAQARRPPPRSSGRCRSCCACPPVPSTSSALGDRRDGRASRRAARPTPRRSDAALVPELDDLQERLFANGRADARDRPAGAARAAGHGHLGQGRGDPARDRHGRPAGRPDHRRSRRRPRPSWRTRSCGGSSARCPGPG